MENILKGIKTILFCDESKFYINDGDLEDEIYYFAVSVEKLQVPHVNREINRVVEKHRVKTKVFHSTKIFKETRPRSEFMRDLTQIIIDNKLHCFCHKYHKSSLFEATKNLKNYNTDIINFEKVEFQALFYFLITLNTYLRDLNPKLLKKEISMYFDRNVYGVEDIEAFNFPSEHFILKQMTFSEKSLISLLSLPDFFGYIFRKAKKSHNKNQLDSNNTETSELVINSYKCLLEITNAKLFHFLDFDPKILGKALKIEI